MAQFLEPTDLEQALLYHHRERRRSHQDIMTGLFKTSSVGVTATPDLTALPKTNSMTFAMKVKTTGVPAGTFFTLGGTTIAVAAGVLTLGWSGQTQASAAIAALQFDASGDNQTFDLAVAIWPGKKRARLYIDGFQAATITHPGNPTEWAGAGSLSRGGTNISYVSGISFHSKQTPRFF